MGRKGMVAGRSGDADRAPINSRRKGATGERDFAATIEFLAGVRLERRLDQSRAGGYDLAPNPRDTSPAANELRRWAIEVKRHKAATPTLLSKWWLQATESAAEASLIPALAYRCDRRPWRILVPLWVLHGHPPAAVEYSFTAEISTEAFAGIVRLRAILTSPEGDFGSKQ